MKTASPEETTSCKEFLLKNEYAVVATTNGEGIPEAAVVTYIMDRDWNIYFFTRKHTYKHRNLISNSLIALVIGTGPESQTVQINGIAEPLTDEENEHWMNEFLAEREGFYSTFLKLQGYDFAGYKVRPRRIRWLHVTEGEENEDQVEVRVT